jgi:protease I
MANELQGKRLQGKRIAIVATDGFEQSELTEPKRALEQAGAKVDVVAPHAGQIQGMQHHEKGATVAVDRTIEEVRPDEYDHLVLPGGVANPDALRLQPRVIAFIRSFFDAGKPVAAICHGPWTLIEADAVKGRTMTSWPSLKTDLKNAGARWVDRETVVEGGLVTSRKPDDLPAFCREMIKLFQSGTANNRQAAE